MSTPDKKPTFSVIMTVCDQSQELAANLPQLLAQQYEGYEVIVVDESSTDESADTLKQLKADHPHLYTTFLPKYQFQKNRRRLAFTIGVKAAKNEWIVLADIATPPPSDQWLAELSEFCCATEVLLLGYVNKKSGDVRLRPYDDIHQVRHIVSKAERWKAGIGRDRWMRFFKKSTCYDFIAVRATHAHDLLRLFALDPSMRAAYKER